LGGHPALVKITHFFRMRIEIIDEYRRFPASPMPRDITGHQDFLLSDHKHESYPKNAGNAPE